MRVTSHPNTGLPSHLQTKDKGSLLRGARGGGGEHWRRLGADVVRSRDHWQRPGDLGQASEHLTLGSLRPCGSRKGGRLSPEAVASEGSAGAEARPLTAPYVRLRATTSFAWFWCGCCASRKASFTESRFFAAAMAPPRELPAGGCSSQAARTQFPPASRRPARQHPGRGYRRSFQITLAGGRDPAGFSREAGPGSRERPNYSRPRLHSRCWYASAGGVACWFSSRKRRFSDHSPWAWPEVASSRSGSVAGVQLSGQSWWLLVCRCCVWGEKAEKTRREESKACWEHALRSCCLTRESERRRHLRESRRGPVRGSGKSGGSGDHLGEGSCSPSDSGRRSGILGTWEEKGRVNLGCSRWGCCSSPGLPYRLHNNSSKLRRTQTLQKDFGVLVRPRTGDVKLSQNEYLSLGLGHASPKCETHLAYCLVILQNCSPLSCL